MTAGVIKPAAANKAAILGAFFRRLFCASDNSHLGWKSGDSSDCGSKVNFIGAVFHYQYGCRLADLFGAAISPE